MRRRPNQLPLGLTPRYKWGGARPGAGRPRGPRPRVWHRKREAFQGTLPCHVTLRVRSDVPSLRTVGFVRAFERSLAEGCERGEFRVLHYSLQGDHAHFVVESRHRLALGRGMKSLGARLARAANRTFARRGPVLDGRYHHRVLRTPREVRNAIAYVLLNARKHLEKHGRKPTGGGLSVDPASSGRWFDGWTLRVQPVSSGEEASVAKPRSWLARIGWRRHGRIDPGQ